MLAANRISAVVDQRASHKLTAARGVQRCVDGDPDRQAREGQSTIAEVLGELDDALLPLLYRRIDVVDHLRGYFDLREENQGGKNIPKRSALNLFVLLWRREGVCVCVCVYQANDDAGHPAQKRDSRFLELLQCGFHLGSQSSCLEGLRLRKYSRVTIFVPRSKFG